tara:strand:- start:2426 stop:7042 length:4617 start_codon:yes stop_codon:yes gene_type:complete
MATRNLVPRGNNEGSLGIPTQRWSALHVASISTDALKVGDNLSLFTNGVGISSISANNDGQFVIAMTSAFLEDLGFTTDGGINSGFTRNDGQALTNDDSIAAGDSFKVAIQKINDDLRGVAAPNDLTVASFDAAAITISGEAFADNDTTLMTSAAIDDRILSFGYTTNTGDITAVAAGVGLSGGGVDGDVSIAIDDTVVTTLAGAQILTNKTLTTPILTTPKINDTSADHTYNFVVSELTGNRNITLPLLAGNDTFVFESHTQTLTNKTLTSAVLDTGISGTAIKDEDNMVSDSDTHLATQQSIKAYVDTQVGAVDLDLQGDDNVALAIDLDNEVLTIAGGTGISTTGAANTLTVGLDNTDIATQTDGLFLDAQDAPRNGVGDTASIGSGTAIPVLTLNKQGQVTATSTASVVTTLTVDADGPTTSNVSLADDDLIIAGGADLTSAVAKNGTDVTVTLELDETTVINGDDQLGNAQVAWAGNDTSFQYGDANTVAQFTVDRKGRLTQAKNIDISITSSQVDDATSANTADKIVIRDGSGDFSARTITATTFSGDLTGNVTGNATSADSADKWDTARTVTFATGDVTGSFSIDGSAHVGNVALSIAANSVDLGAHTTGNYVQSVTAGTGIGAIAAASEGAAVTVGVNGVLEDLDTLGAATANGEFIVATGPGVFAYESGDTARLSLGLGSTDSPSFAGNTSGNIQIGITGDNEIDTDQGNLTIDSAGGTVTVDDHLIVSGNLTINGNQFQVDGTTIQLDDNLIELGLINKAAPTEAVTKDLGLLLHDHGAEQGTATIHSIYWDNSDEKFRLESGVSEDNQGILSGGTAAGLVVGALEASSLSLSTDLAVSEGGTGASALTDHGVLVGSGTNAITALAVGTNGQLLMGSNGADPVFGTLSAGDGLTSTAGAGSLALAVDLKANSGLVIDNGEIAVDLGASNITGTLEVGDGGTGVASLSDIVNAANGGITVTDGTGTVIDGNVSLALNLNDLTAIAAAGEHALDVANDSIAIIDKANGDGADVNVTRKETIGNLISAAAGAGLSATDGVLALDLSEIGDGAIASGDKFLMLDSDNSTEQLETIDDIGSYISSATNSGLTSSSGQLSLDLNDVAAADIAVGDDSIVFVDKNRTDNTCDYNNSTTITMDDTSFLSVGMTVTGTGIPNGATVDSITDGTTFELSAATTDGQVTNGELTFGVNATRKETIGDLITAVAGAGLGASSGVLSVTVDDSTIEINTDTVRVKDDGITLAKLAHFSDLSVNEGADGNRTTAVVIGAQANATTPVEITIKDEDSMISNSATSLATQQSIKSYVDSQVGLVDLDFTTDTEDGNGDKVAGSVDLDEQTLAFSGTANKISVTHANQAITVNVGSDIVQLDADQTLTTKTISGSDNTITNLTTSAIHADTLVLEAEGIASNDNDTTLPTSAAVKDYVDDQLGRFGGIFTTDSSDNELGANVQYNRDVIFDSTPLVRSHFGPFGFDLGQLITEDESDLTFFGSTSTQASDRHFLVIGSTVGNDTKGDCKFTGASFVAGNEDLQTP